MPVAREDEQLLAIHDEAARLINEIVGDEFNTDCITSYEERIVEKEKALEARQETLQLEGSIYERDRQNKLQYVAESNSRVLGRAKEVLGMAEQVSGQVGEIVARTIKLDQAQRNLTITITLLERFKSFVENIDRLERLLLNKGFSKMAPLLLATQQFCETFSRIDSSQFVKEQVGRFGHLQKMIQRQLMDLFETTLKKQRNAVVDADALLLAHAALVIGVLGDDCRDQLIRWYCTRQLIDYKDVFRGNVELGNLESVPKRYAWLKRLLIAYEAEHAVIFPDDWKVDLALCVDFCTITCQDLYKILLSAQDASKIDLVVLQASVQATRQFEQFLQKKFSVDRRSGLVISLAFEPYLGHFVTAHKQDIGDYIKALPTKLSQGDFEASHHVLSSAAELFLLFKEVLQDISDLSVKKPLADLCSVLGGQLSFYCKYLEGRIPPVSSKKPLSIFECKILCIIVNTGDYCAVTVEQMEERMLSLIDSKCRDEVQFDSIKQDFLIVVSAALSRIFKSLETSIEPVWTCFLQSKWSELKMVGDTGEYVGRMQKLLGDLLFPIRAAIIEPKHYMSLCNRLAITILKRLNELVKSIKPLTEVISQQLLIDLEAIKSCLMDSMKVGKYSVLKESFHKLVNKEVTATEKLLKCLLLQPEPANFFVQNYVLIMADGDEDKFLKLLDLRGIKRTQQALYLEEFKKMIPQRPSDVGTITKESDFAKLNSQLKRMLGSLGNTIK